MCRYCNYGDGKCDFWSNDPEEIMFEHIATSCDENGVCMVDDDPDPSFSCEDYEE